MFSIFELGDDGFREVLSWLDVGCICRLDIAIGNVDERLLWLRSLHTMDSKAVDEYGHSHSSLRWLISRGARATMIRVKGINLESDRITDQTFEGIGLLCAQNVDNGGGDAIHVHSSIRYSLRNREIKVDTNTVVSVRPWGCHQLTSIDLGGCGSISDIGLSAIAEGCHHLTSINLMNCYVLSDIGLSAIAEGCPRLTSINLYSCVRISDIGLTAIVQGCHHLEFINLSDCDRISYVGVSAIAGGCRHLTTIDIYDSLTQEQLSIIKSNYPHLHIHHN